MWEGVGAGEVNAGHGRARGDVGRGVGAIILCDTMYQPNTQIALNFHQDIP